MSTKKLMNKIYKDDINAFIGLDYSHMGYWLDTNANNFKMAQEESLKQLVKSLDSTPGQTILDIGGGQGGTAIWLAQNYGCNVVVVDIVPQMIDAGIQKVKQLGLEEKIQLHCCDFLEFESERKFDAIISVEAIHHIKNNKKLFEQCFRMLKPGGKFSMSVYVAHFRPKWLLNQYLLLTIGDKNILPVVDYETSAAQAGFQEFSTNDVSDDVLPKSSEILQQEPYISRIKAYHIKYYGRMSVWFMPLFMNWNNRIMKKKRLKLIFINGRKPE